MDRRIAPSLALVGVLAVAGFAALRGSSADSVPEPDTRPSQPTSPAPSPAQPQSNPHADLPPSHPAVGASPSPHAIAPGAPTTAAPGEPDPGEIAWKVPPAWQTAPNPSAMRLATYRAPHAASDADDAEMSVMRAGGTTDANIARWVGQFKDASPEKRTVKTVRGFKVTIVEIAGTYAGGGMMVGGGAAPSARPGWALLGAIVETPGSPYFFKMTGPAATVRAARPAFDGLVESIGPK